MRRSTMRIGFLAFALLSFFSFSWASGQNSQNNCPEGFQFVGTLSGRGTESNPFDQRETVKFPEDATLDQTFQQKNVHATNGLHGAHSALQANEIPKGVLLIVHGKEDKLYQPGWAVSEPALKAIDQDANGKVTRYEFGMKLFCSVGSRGQNPYYAVCSVDVEVCYKPARQ